MTKALVLVGKIGPSFGGARINAWGTAEVRVPSDMRDAVATNGVKAVRNFNADTLALGFTIIAENMSDGMEYKYDIGADSNYTLAPLLDN